MEVKIMFVSKTGSTKAAKGCGEKVSYFSVLGPN
jgi:hypothetical protein